MELPEPLAGRVTRLSEAPCVGAYVLVWLRTALRADENPALDVALIAGRTLGLPVFVYQGLSDRTPWATARVHTFVLEGAAELHAGLAARGIGSALHVERDGHRGPHLKALASRAALVITEDHPVPPLAGWTRRLAAAIPAPVWLVDTATVAGLPRIGRAYDRAFAFRKAVQPLWDAQIARPWVDEPAHTAPFVPDLPFTPAPLDDLPALIAQTDVDASVGPAPDLRGGTAAGMARWAAFRADGLAAYARRRNDPLVDGTSRISPWLHFGMIAPTRIAREAHQDGAAKFLDELLTWRELAYAWARFRGFEDAWGTLPAWARETLEATHQPERVLDAETLARGRTGDPLWDTAQRGLLVRGELHNNVRMTWGKAVLRWSASPRQALDRVIDLNHRYALDGRDPASWAGILWCFGLFDRPFPPDARGSTLRPRPTAQHARRLDVSAWSRKLARPGVPTRVLVIGAGLAGAMAARTLADHGLDVQIVDKARGAGGRTSTRRGDVAFDHGAPCLALRHPTLRRLRDAWLDAGLLARWQAPWARWTDGPTPLDLPDRFVGVPGMSALARHLLADLTPRYEARVERLEADGDGWIAHLTDASTLRADRVVITTPPEQAGALHPTLADRARSTPRQVALLTLDAEPAAARDFGALLLDGPVERLVREHTKPGRGSRPGWLLAASEAWSIAHLEDPPEQVAAALIAALPAALQVTPISAVAHRWRYAFASGPATPIQVGSLFLAGDGFSPGKGDGALRAGMSVASLVLGSLSPPTA